MNDRIAREIIDAVTPAQGGSRGSLARSALAIVLAGGCGTRLHELTAWRAKPAVPFGGKFRIVDFVLSNCVNSGIRRVGIATQYKAQSLIRHVQRGWSFFDGRFDEFVELLPAQQWLEPSWYRGTADAVYQNLDIVRRHAPKHVLVLSGDQIYKMDYLRLLEEHAGRRADVTIACVDVPIAEAPAFDIVCADRTQRVVGFEEKPENPAPCPECADRALASMGVYAFEAGFLYEQLARDAADGSSRHDFGGDVIPRALAQGARVCAHDFAASCVHAGTVPYWRDVGTIDAYWRANIALTDVVPEFDLYDRTWPVWTYQEQAPPAKFVFDDDGRRGVAIDSLVSGGCIISGSTVRRSLLFPFVNVGDGSTVEQSVVLPYVDVGRGVVLRRTVVDKHCMLPDGFTAGVDAERDRARFRVTEGGITLITPEMLGQPVHHVQSAAAAVRRPDA